MKEEKNAVDVLETADIKIYKTNSISAKKNINTFILNIAKGEILPGHTFRINPFSAGHRG